MGLVHKGTGTQWNWYTVGLVHLGTVPLQWFQDHCHVSSPAVVRTLKSGFLQVWPRGVFWEWPEAAGVCRRVQQDPARVLPAGRVPAEAQRHAVRAGRSRPHQHLAADTHLLRRLSDLSGQGKPLSVFSGLGSQGKPLCPFGVFRSRRQEKPLLWCFPI